MGTVERYRGSYVCLPAALLSNISTSIASGTHSALTVFAPTNAAFDEYLSAFNVTATQLLASPALRDILLYHVVPQAYSVSAFGGPQPLPAWQHSCLCTASCIADM